MSLEKNATSLNRQELIWCIRESVDSLRRIAVDAAIYAILKQKP